MGRLRDEIRQTAVDAVRKAEWTLSRVTLIKPAPVWFRNQACWNLFKEILEGVSPGVRIWTDGTGVWVKTKRSRIKEEIEEIENGL